MNESPPEYKKLVKAVDRRETDKSDENSPADWSNRVERAIDEGQKNIIRTANLVREFIPDFDVYLKESLDAYAKEVTRIRNGLPSRQETLTEVDPLIKDLLDGSEQNAQEAQVIALAQKNPVSILSNIRLFQDKSYVETLLETTLVTLIDKKEGYRVFDYFSLFKDKPYLDRELIRGLTVVHEKGGYEFLSFLEEMAAKTPHLMNDPAVKDMVSKEATDLTFRDPGLAMEKFSLFEQLPHADQLLLFQVDILAKRNPKVLMQHVDLWVDKVTDLDKIVRGLVDHVRYSDPVLCLKILSRFPTVEFPDKAKLIEETVRTMVKVRPDIFLEQQAGFKGLSYYDEVVKIATRRKVIFDALKTDAIAISTADFLADPALKDVHLIEPSWFENLSAVDFGKVASYLCRNLYLQNKPISKEGAQAEYKNWLSLREEYSGQALFAGRNVVLASHSETWPDGGRRFAPDKVVEDIQRQQGEGVSFEHLEAKDQSIQAIQEAKTKTLDALLNTPPPFTFVFHGHGGHDAIYLSDGQSLETDIQPPSELSKVNETQHTIKITVQELTEVLLERSKKYPNLVERPDILIFQSCYNHTFIRNLYTQVKENKGRLPITLGASEYDQLGYDMRANEYSNVFFRDVLDLGSEKTTLGDVWGNEEKGYSNPTLYIPSNIDGSIPLQLAQNNLGSTHTA